MSTTFDPVIAPEAPTAAATESICVLIPCLHEQREIGAMVREFRELWPSCRIIVVDNCSTGSTLEMARAAGAEVIREHRRGKAAAILSVLPQIDTDVLILAPADGSYPAEGARRLLEYYRWEKPDMITGLRRPEGNEAAPSEAGRVHRKLLSLAFGQAPEDLFSELRLLSRFFYKNIPILLRGLDLELELTVQALDKNFRLASVPVPWRPPARQAARKPAGVRRFLLVLLRDYKPMLLFGMVAAVFCLAGLTVGSVPIYEYFTTGIVHRLSLPVLAAALMIIAFFTFQIGMLMEASLRYRRETYQTQLRSHYESR